MSVKVTKFVVKRDDIKIRRFYRNKKHQKVMLKNYAQNEKQQFQDILTDPYQGCYAKNSNDFKFCVRFNLMLNVECIINFI